MSELRGVIKHHEKIVARWMFSSRQGGVSQAPYDSLNLATHVGDAAIAVAMNRAAAAENFGVVADKLSWPECVHGDAIAEVTRASHCVLGVDGLFTSQKKIPLMALAADCVPLLLVDSTSHWAAAIHCGWKGAATGMADSIEHLIKRNSKSLKHVTAIAGPSICADCYPVDAERREAVVSQLPAAAHATGVGIREGLLSRLAHQGVSVQSVGGCTFEDPQFFSHRREGNCGRQAGFVMLV